MALVLGVALSVWRMQRPTPLTAIAAADTVLESGAAESAATLAEGSRVVLDPDSRIRLADAAATSVRIEVQRGGVTVDATHRDDRTFAVLAAGHEVRVVGTRFSVRLQGVHVTVRVERGEVSVRAPDGSQRALRAGETWSSEAGDLPPAAAGRGSNPDVRETQAQPAGAAASGSLGAGLPTGSPETAKGLLSSAQRARAEGRDADAALLFDKLRRTWRSDPRAPLAAFELGRLRLDVLDDPRGAEEALRDALVLGSKSPLRQEVEAARIEALSRIGDAAGCRAARDAYLTRYPDGVYSKAIGAYCGGR
jgi:transmembrane sensor